MKTLYVMVFRSLVPVFVGMLLISVVLFELVYFFGELTRYLDDEEVRAGDYLWVVGLYVPLAVSYASPLSLLFALVFTLSSMYDNQEMTVIHSGGISLVGFGMPILALGFFLSLGTFYFDNFVVTRSERMRNEYFNTVFRRDQVNRSEVVVAVTNEGKRLYIANSFNPETTELKELSIVDKDDIGHVYRRIDAVRAIWDKDRELWRLQQVRIFYYDSDGRVTENQEVIKVDQDINEPVQSFATNNLPIEEMSLSAAYEYLNSLKQRKLPHLDTAVSFHQRFAFPFTALIVSLIGLAMVSRFRQNTLLMGLLASIGIAVVFYIFRLYSGIAGTEGYVPPWLSGWLGTLFFLGVGMLLFFGAPS
ncbi:LptF/LptG family permease [Candidatus Haliotispira prima]|uniref:LptF/LptG family permease n=1 Tax=Candidatus Haliotispira prima TaxID=3034016 RepID=A0ABY8MJ19_9SPIO|nr:LptF/LptG family permease [Candidatus Haliotispira prima]